MSYNKKQNKSKRGNHSFTRAPSITLNRSQFDRSCGYKGSLNAGLLIPFYVEETLPGDTFTVSATLFGRMATPIFPIMDNLYIDTHFFAVPNRLIWDNWAKMMGEQENPGDTTSYVVPQYEAETGFVQGSMEDHMGIPTQIGPITINALHHRAGNLIYNQWFRDQNLTDSLLVPKDDGPDDIAGTYSLRRRAKKHDYFTSCLPYPLKGEAVEIPLGSSAPVTITGDTGPPLWDISGNTRHLRSSAAASSDVLWDQTNAASNISALWEDPQLIGVADLSSATAATINQLRQATAIQRMLEKDARGGTRLIEVVRAHFQVSSPDARMQRSEYLGGSTTPISIQAVAQTSTLNNQSNDTVGTLGATGTIASGRGHGFHKSFTEHCVIVGYVSIRADINYQQGLDRMWSRSSRYDFFWPDLAHLGEQAVLNKEIYFQGIPGDDSDQDDGVFGYQERFSEYRYKNSTITGALRSNSAVPLDPWHLAESFDSLPVLDNEFIESNPPVERVVAVPSEPHFILDTWFNANVVRPIPMYGIPGNTPRF